MSRKKSIKYKLGNSDSVVAALFEEVSSIKKKVEERDKFFDKLHIAVQEIHSAITGNKDLGHVGLAERTDKVEKKVESINMDRTRLLTLFGIIASTAIILAPIIVLLIKHFFGW